MRSLLILAFLTFVLFVFAQKQLAHSPRIVNSKTVYFQNTTGSDAVGSEAPAELKKWGKYQIVSDRSKPTYSSFFLRIHIRAETSNTQVGKPARSTITAMSRRTAFPTTQRHYQLAHAYLAVIDPKTGENLWSDEHLWGGLLTGFNSVGARLISQLESQMKH